MVSEKCIWPVPFLLIFMETQRYRHRPMETRRNPAGCEIMSQCTEMASPTASEVMSVKCSLIPASLSVWLLRKGTSQ